MDNRALCLLYLMGEASEEEVAALSEWIAESPEHAEAFALLAAQDAYLSTAVARACKPERPPADLLQELAALEQASSPAQLVDLTDEVMQSQRLARQKQQELKRQAKPNRPDQQLLLIIPKAVVWAGLAAAVALAATLLFYVTDNGEGPGEVVEQPDPDRQQPVDLPTFAVVIRSLDARWETGGDPSGYLREGNHTLSQGMVEIKLLSGTTVVLEAPVSFVLTGINTMGVLNGRAVADVPRSGAGFTLDTPSARFVETAGQYNTLEPDRTNARVLGWQTNRRLVSVSSIQSRQHTEFGVHVDGTRQTHVQVFSGEVQANPLDDGEIAGTPFTLGDEASAVIAPGTTPTLVDFDALAFQRDITTRLSLTDMVMGGDGTTQRQNVGLHPLTGQMMRRVEGNQSLIGLVSPGRAQPVPGSSYVSAVFIPSQDGHLQGLPAGLTLPSLPETNGYGFGVIWSGDEMPSIMPEQDNAIPARLPGYNFAGSGQQAMVMHTNCGLIIDLDAVRAAYPGFEIIAIKAVAGNASPRVEAGSKADFKSEFLVYLDSELVVRSTFLSSAPDDQRVAPIDLSVHASDRYLTLVSADGGDGNHRDWVVLGDPVIVLKPLLNPEIDF